MTRPRGVLVVGAGSIGERHVRCFAATGRARVSVCEVNAEVRQTVADKYAISRVYDRLETALDAKPEIVVIATPAHLHVAMAASAVLAGAHVLIEKPLATSLEGVDELVESAGKRGVVVGVAYVYRCHPALAAMRAGIKSGRFGRPLEIVATCGQHFPHYRPAYRDTYYKDRASGGGAVQDALTHIVNAGEWLVGPIDRVAADLGHQALEGVSVEDTVHVIARHGPVMGSYSLNQHQAANESTITVVCSQGMVRFEYHESRWRWMIEPGGAWTDEDAAPLERDTLFTLQAVSFIDAVECKAPPPCTLAEARQTLRVNLAILSSAERGDWQAIEARD